MYPEYCHVKVGYFHGFNNTWDNFVFEIVSSGNTISKKKLCICAVKNINSCTMGYKAVPLLKRVN